MALSERDAGAAARELVGGLPVIALLPPGVRDLVVESFVPMEFLFGENLVRQGDEPDGFYVIASGMARMLHVADDGEEVSLGVLRPGDTFGETGLLEGAPRTATVRASSPLEALRLEPAVFNALVSVHPEVHEAFSLQARARHIEHFLRVDSAFSRLPHAAIATMLERVELVAVAAGDAAVRQGDESGPMYIVQDGKLVVYEEADGTKQMLRYLRTGDFFGEVSLMRGTPRTATVEAVTDASLIAIGPEIFQKLLEEHEEFRARVEERLHLYERGPAANVPIDFADEVLPAGAVEAAILETETSGGGITGIEWRGGMAEDTPDLDAAGDVAAREPEAEEKRPFWRRRKKFPHVRQIDEMDCGAACIAMVCRHYGRPVSISWVRQAVGTGVDGTSLRGIQRGGEFVGLEVKAVKVSKERLDDLPLPAIVHWGGNHWVVLHGVDGDRVHVADPARSGNARISRDELMEEWTGYAALPRPTPKLAEQPTGGSAQKWMWQFLRPHKGRLIIVLILAFVGSALEMVFPIVSANIIDDGIGGEDYSVVHLFSAAMLFLLGISLCASLVQGRLLSRVAVEIDGKTLDHVSARMLNLPLSYFETRRTGDIERRLDGLREIRGIIIGEGVAGLTAGIQFLVALAIMLNFSLLLGGIFIATLPVYGLLMRYSSRRMQPLFESLESSYGRYRSQQIDAIKGIETVKSLGAEEGLRKRLLGEWDRLADRVFRSDYLMLMYGGVVSAATFTIMVLFLWLGALEVLAGRMSIGELLAFNSLIMLAIGPLGVLLALWDEAQMAKVLIARLEDILEQDPEQADDADLRAVPSVEGHITLRGVGFRFPTAPTQPILSDITLDVPPGTTVALVGRSGSGKSTLVKCLAGLMPVTEGSISIDGMDLRELRFADLRKRIGFVLQQPYMFDDTIARNIAFGEDEPDLERVQWAAEVANASEFIDRLPLGYETRVGESGLRVSGGQSQRLAIARALYHRPAVVLLDEATSALDTESERAVKKNMDRLLANRTAFIVAHRLSTVRDADLIVVLERGRIAETGTHEDLMRREGLYFYLQSQQLA